MLIQDLTKELDSSAMAAIHGGLMIDPRVRIRNIKFPPSLFNAPPRIDSEPDGSVAFLLPPGAAD